MSVGTVSNNTLDIQSFLVNGSNSLEPMYSAEMDTDEDGVVSLDEFKDYCKEKGINTRGMIKMSQLAASYRTMKAEAEAMDYISKLIPNVFPHLKEPDSKSGYLRQEEDQYNISNNPNQDKMVKYDEYMEYCEQNVVPNELKSNAKAEEAGNGNLKISNTGKALASYINNENSAIKNTFEKLV